MSAVLSAALVALAVWLLMPPAPRLAVRVERARESRRAPAMVVGLLAVVAVALLAVAAGLPLGARGLLWLATAPVAATLAREPALIELQTLVREQQLL